MAAISCAGHDLATTTKPRVKNAVEVDVFMCGKRTLQVLIYPKLTATTERSLKSYQEYKDGPIFTMELVDMWVKQLLKFTIYHTYVGYAYDNTEK